jgi:hypothetical protein
LFFRRASTKSKKERGIFVKHFKNIPMADMEIVLVSDILFVSFDNFFHLQTNKQTQLMTLVMKFLLDSQKRKTLD